jgi:hypothetical protein
MDVKKSGQDESDKKTISRLVISKIMSSDIVKYMYEQSLTKLNAAFLSETPDSDLSLEFRHRISSTSNVSFAYSDHIASVTVKWENKGEEIVDLEGNVWATWTLKVLPSIASTWSAPYPVFMERVDCISSLGVLVTEITDMVGGPVRIKILNNEERIERDEKKKHAATCDALSKAFMGEGRDYRRGLRRGGRSRAVPRDLQCLTPRVEPGMYEFDINDGSRYSPKIKKYVYVLPEDPFRSARLSRIA